MHDPIKNANSAFRFRTNSAYVKAEQIDYAIMSGFELARRAGLPPAWAVDIADYQYTEHMKADTFLRQR